MARFVADQNSVLFIYESGTYTNASGTGQSFGLVTENNIVDSENVQQIRHLSTNNRNVDVFTDGALDHEGTMTYHPQDWKMLGFALGSVVDAGSPSPYTHTLSELDNDGKYAFTSGALCPFASFTVEDSQSIGITGSNFVRTANGCVIDSFELSASEGEIATISLTYVPQSVSFSSGAPTSVTTSTTRPFLWSDFKIHLPSGTTIDETKSMTFSLSNNLGKPHYLNGSRVIGVPSAQNREYEVSLTVDATSQRTKTFYDQYFRGGSEFNMMIEVTDVSAGAGSRDAFIIMSGCRIMEMETPSPNENVNEQTLTIMPKNAIVNVNDTIQLYNPF